MPTASSAIAPMKYRRVIAFIGILPAGPSARPVSSDLSPGQRLGASKNSHRPAVARHALAQAAVVVAEPGFEVALLAPHHAEVDDQGAERQQQERPVGRERKREPE